MSRDPELYLDDIRESCRRVLEYTKGRSFEGFAADTRTIDAVARNLEIIGEAAKRLPNTIKDRHRHVEWRKIMGLRDMLAHAYFGIDIEIIWDVVQNKIPGLLEDLSEPNGRS